MNQVAVIHNISREDFYDNYVKTSQPVLLKGLTGEWPALSNWNADYFRQIEGELKLATKTGDVSEGKRSSMLLSEYVDLLTAYEDQVKRGEQPPRPPYLHDVPIFHLLPSLVKDVSPFPCQLFPKWYQKNWHNYVQFFMGGTGSLTPLHFDTLCTHNLFFQVTGSKRFLLISKEEKERCYIEGWRWAKFNPNEKDYNKFPMAKDVVIKEVVIGPGDILFIPSGTLHQVHGLSYSISFNIDWHTPATAMTGVLSGLKGAPRKNVYYNMLSLMGVGLKVPSKFIFPYYKSYLNYVS